jgi:hypothetical protein
VHFARTHQAIEGLERHVNWRGRVWPVLLEQIDEVGAEPPEAAFDGRDYAFRSKLRRLALRFVAELRGDDDAAPLGAQGSAEVFL